MPRNNMDSTRNRGVLFGAPGAGAGGGGQFAASAEEDMERGNQDQIERLSERVTLLKGLTSQIGDAVRDDNGFLDSMTDDFDRTGGLLGSARNKLNVMVRSGGGSHMCYLVVFVVVFFFMMYRMAS